MKILTAGFIIFLLAATGFGQCAEPTVNDAGTSLGVKTFEVKKQFAPAEISLSLTASAENASWEKKDAESAVVTIFIDGKYNQDVMLFAGAAKFTYRVMLGNFAAGKHQIRFVFNKSRSAKNISQAKIYSAEIAPLAAGSPAEKMALANTPILYLRPDTIDRFSDIPLLTYYEILPGTENDSYKIRYTTIFTNEDGGTQTAALMARWGRATDIEWFYEIEVKDNAIRGQIIQGVNHVTKDFAGQRLFGGHPVIFDASDNNNFDDAGCSALRTSLLPIRADLSKKSRETVMDENPWTYRLMAQEAAREGRVDPNNLGANTIDDLRNYLYVEVYTQNTSIAIGVEAQTDDGKVSRSDHNDARLRIERGGYQRIAVRLPSATARLQSLRLICEASSKPSKPGETQNGAIIKFVRLDKNFNLLETKNPDGAVHPVKAGEKLNWTISNGN